MLSNKACSRSWSGSLCRSDVFIAESWCSITSETILLPFLLSTALVWQQKSCVAHSLTSSCWATRHEMQLVQMVSGSLMCSGNLACVWEVTSRLADNADLVFIVTATGTVLAVSSFLFSTFQTLCLTLIFYKLICLVDSLVKISKEDPHFLCFLWNFFASECYVLWCYFLFNGL